MAIRDILFVLAPEFITTDPTELSRIDTVIELAGADVNRSVWGTKADRGVALLAAHLLTIAGRGGSGPSGPVVSERAGGRSVEYARTQPLSGQPDPYTASTYGQEFRRIRDTLDTGPILL